MQDIIHIPLLNKFHAYNNNLFEMLIHRTFYCSTYEKLNDPYDCRPRLSDNFIQLLFDDEQTIQPYYIEFLKINNGRMNADPFNLNGFNPKQEHLTLPRDEKLKLVFKNQYTRELFYSAYSRIYNIRIVSFSSVEHSEESDKLMWAHYANRFSGVRLTFDFSRSIKFINSKDLFKVNYLSKTGHINSEVEFYEYFQCKTELWDKEKEYRIIIRDLIEESFISFDKECLTEITFGQNMSYDQRKAIKTLTEALGYKCKYFILDWNETGLSKIPYYF